MVKQGFQITKELVKKMGLTCEVSLDGQVICLEVADPAVLIGNRGKNIAALETLVRSILFKRGGQQPAPRIDVNNYRKRQAELVARLARDGAYRAVVLKKTIVLKPMSAYERRIVHMELSGRSEVVTESQGQGLGRYVVISPAV